MSTRTEHVETLQGQGTLVLPDSKLSVDYVVRVLQHYSNDNPTLKEAAGTLSGFSHSDVVFAVLAGQPLKLVLQDGRCAQIRLAGLDGDFEVTGPIGHP